MDLLSTAQASGHRIVLLTTDPRHIGGTSKAAGRAQGAGYTASTAVGGAASDPEASFGNLFLQSLGQVNDLQVRAQDLSQALLTDPDSVDVHEVTVALAEANLALSMTKAVIDRAIRAYREIVNIR
jgi:flagellar hook-basal body complex protein FliE